MPEGRKLQIALHFKMKGELFYNLLLRSKEKEGKCICTSFSGAAPAI